MASVYSVTTESEEALAAATAETVVLLRGSTAVKAGQTQSKSDAALPLPIVA